MYTASAGILISAEMWFELQIAVILGLHYIALKFIMPSLQIRKIMHYNVRYVVLTTTVVTAMRWWMMHTAMMGVKTEHWLHNQSLLHIAARTQISKLFSYRLQTFSGIQFCYVCPIHLLSIHSGPKKLTHFVSYALTLSILTDFQIYFTVRICRTFIIILLLKIPTHLKCVATLPREISVL